MGTIIPENKEKVVSIKSKNQEFNTRLQFTIDNICINLVKDSV